MRPSFFSLPLLLLLLLLSLEFIAQQKFLDNNYDGVLNTRLFMAELFSFQISFESIAMSTGSLNSVRVFFAVFSSKSINASRLQTQTILAQFLSKTA